MKRILITGARGMLGRALMEQRPGKYEVLGVDVEELDVTSLPDVRRCFADFGPDCVIHCAAMTDVDGCETHRARAIAINAMATLDLARECAARHVPMVYVSTDFVFDGQKREPYTEHDPSHPIGLYGWTKERGEFYTRHFLPPHYIVRTAWTFAPWGHNFVRSILRNARERPELRVVDDQLGSPTYAPDLAEGLWSLIATGAYGTYHMTNQGVVSRYDFAREILAAAGLSHVPVVAIKSAELNQPAKRPAYSALANTKLPPLRPYREALADCLARLGGSDLEAH